VGDQGQIQGDPDPPFFAESHCVGYCKHWVWLQLLHYLILLLSYSCRSLYHSIPKGCLKDQWSLNMMVHNFFHLKMNLKESINKCTSRGCPPDPTKGHTSTLRTTPFFDSWISFCPWWQCGYISLHAGWRRTRSQTNRRCRNQKA
jgi:hypothetical protein